VNQTGIAQLGVLVHKVDSKQEPAQIQTIAEYHQKLKEIVHQQFIVETELANQMKIVILVLLIAVQLHQLRENVKLEGLI
jgi:hypothetical protein